MIYGTYVTHYIDPSFCANS